MGWIRDIRSKKRQSKTGCAAAMMEPKKKYSLSRFRKDEKGVAAVEFAMIAAPFFAIVMFIAEIGLSYFAHKVLSLSTDIVARQIRTGEFKLAGNSSESQRESARAEFIDRICQQSVMPVLFDCSKLKVDVRVIATWADAPDDDVDREEETDPDTGDKSPGAVDEDQFDFQIGGRLSINIVRVFYEWPTIMDFGLDNSSTWVGNKRLMVAKSAFLTEPF